MNRFFTIWRPPDLRAQFLKEQESPLWENLSERIIHFEIMDYVLNGQPFLGAIFDLKFFFCPRGGSYAVDWKTGKFFIMDPVTILKGLIERWLLKKTTEEDREWIRDMDEGGVRDTLTMPEEDG